MEAAGRFDFPPQLAEELCSIINTVSQPLNGANELNKSTKAISKPKRTRPKKNKYEDGSRTSVRLNSKNESVVSTAPVAEVSNFY